MAVCFPEAATPLSYVDLSAGESLFERVSEKSTKPSDDEDKKKHKGSGKKQDKEERKQDKSKKQDPKPVATRKRDRLRGKRHWELYIKLAYSKGQLSFKIAIAFNNKKRKGSNFFVLYLLLFVAFFVSEAGVAMISRL